MPQFNKQFIKQFHQSLSLENTVKLVPKQYERSVPLADKVKVQLHHHLWNIPSATMNHKFIFEKAKRKEIMALEKE